MPGTPSYPEDLPITARKDEILAALEANQVLVVAGETGSGKSTQLPKMCLEAGRGSRRHDRPHPTSPDRGAKHRRAGGRGARARRWAARWGTRSASPTGSATRTLVKVMTDGVLLAELHSDPELRNYDTLIIDEAHERSLNIDFILGYLKRLLPSRPDLKVIVTSATIDTERFSQHFDGAPVIEVPGRMYPVELRYQPLTEPGWTTATDDEPHGRGASSLRCRGRPLPEAPGDILVFLPGEREIRDTADALAKADVTGPRSPVLVRTGSLRPNSTGFSSRTPGVEPSCPQTWPRPLLRCPGSAMSSTSGRPGFRVTAGGPRYSGSP